MKLGPATHKNIFLLFIMLFSIALIIASVLANNDKEMHRAYYERYQAADELFKNGQFEEPYNVYKELSSAYPTAYVLELKMAICAMNTGMWPEAVEHSRRSMELYPLLLKDEDFMDSLSYSLKQLGENEAAARIKDYYYDFVALLE